MLSEISGKRLELFKELFLSSLAWRSLGFDQSRQFTRCVERWKLAAGALGVQILYLDIRDSKDIEAVLANPVSSSADGLLVSEVPLRPKHSRGISDLAVKNRLPAIYYSAGAAVDAGGLLSYATGVSLTRLGRRAATYVDKILKGAKPADLPVEQPTKFELVINLKAAKQIGLTIPPNVLARADRVIR